LSSFAVPAITAVTGWSIARLLHSNGGRVKVFLLGDGSKYQGAAKTNFAIIARLPIEVIKLKGAAAAKKDVAHCDDY
jgi:NAD(P)H-hydrate repair Nnr-like enzyme with NAD(P)H-hydrate epimerase domain